MNKKITGKKLIEKYYKSKKNSEKVSYLPPGIIPKILILAFIASDFIFISQLIDYYFYDDVFKGRMASVIVAIIIDVTPIIISECIMKKKKKLYHYISIGGLTVIEFALFILLGYVRLNSADLIFSFGSTSLISNVNETAEAGMTQGQLGMSWLFVMLPIATSILSFVIGIICNTGAKEKFTDRMAVVNLYDAITLKKAEQIELEYVLDSDFDSETDAKLELAMSDVELEKEIAKKKLKLEQAIKAATPEGAALVFGRKGDTI